MTNLFPLDYLAEQEVLSEESEADIYKSEYAFDFDKGEFILTPTKNVRVDADIDAYKTWALKTLLTPRYKHLAYSRYHGQEFEDLIRLNLNRAANESEIARIITETLMVDERTAEVTDFTFTWLNEEVVCGFVAVTTRGERVALSVNTMA